MGQKLMASLMDAARSKGLSVIEGKVLSNNHKMLKLMLYLDFTIKISEEDHRNMKVSKTL